MPRYYIEAVPEMGDDELLQACVDSDPGPFYDAARAELIANRCLTAEDIADEEDRVWHQRARHQKAAREELALAHGEV